MIGTLGQFVREIRDRLAGNGEPVHVISGIKIPEHDYVELGYTAGNLTTAVYKNGGSSGTPVATLTLVYDGLNNLISVTKV